MRVGVGIEMLAVSAVVMGKTETVYPVLLWDKETVVLVDTGFPGEKRVFSK